MTAQLENGYTRIANELMEAISMAKFNGSQFRIVLAVLRQTYGFNRKSAEISISFLSKATGIEERHIRKEVDRLINSHVLNEYAPPTNTSSREMGVNKDYTQWCICTRGTGIPEEQIHPTGEEQLDQGGEEQTLHPGEEQLPPQEIQPKENIKDNIKNMLFEHWRSLNIIRHKELTPEISRALDKVIKDPEYFITCMDHYATMYHDKTYKLCSYPWGLVTFFGREKGYKLFDNEGEKWLHYQQHLKERASPPVKAITATKPPEQQYEIYVPPKHLVNST